MCDHLVACNVGEGLPGNPTLAMAVTEDEEILIEIKMAGASFTGGKSALLYAICTTVSEMRSGIFDEKSKITVGYCGAQCVGLYSRGYKLRGREFTDTDHQWGCIQQAYASLQAGVKFGAGTDEGATLEDVHFIFPTITSRQTGVFDRGIRLPMSHSGDMSFASTTRREEAETTVAELLQARSAERELNDDDYGFGDDY